MAKGRREFEGDNIAWLITRVQYAVWGGEVLELDDVNPYRDPTPPSEAMQKHLATERARRLRHLGKRD